MVEKMESIKSQYGVSILSLVDLAQLSLPSYMRWKKRLSASQEPIRKPGAKKVLPIDLKKLKRRIDSLTHGKKRSNGTGQLYHANRQRISRREFNALVREVRDEFNRRQVVSRCQVDWLRPDLAWALDGLEYGQCHVQNLQDLCSRYKFVPLTTSCFPCGESIAGYLSRHLTHFGPPLFLKRDNGSNLNHISVNDLLEEHMIIPINSPVYTPTYNGAIEHSQGELKTWLRQWEDTTHRESDIAVRVENAAHGINHRPRQSLSGENACRSYFSSSRLRANKRKRKEVFDWIQDLAVDISAKSGKDKISPTAWRVSARKWLEKNRMIVIRKPAEVLPLFFLKNCHN